MTTALTTNHQGSHQHEQHHASEGRLQERVVFHGLVHHNLRPRLHLNWGVGIEASIATVTVSMGYSAPGSAAERSNWCPRLGRRSRKDTVCELPLAVVNVKKCSPSPTMFDVACHATSAAKAELMVVETVQVKVNQPLAAKSTSMASGVHVMVASAELREESLGQWSGLKAPNVALSP